MSNLYIQIPCQYKNDRLVIKALNIQGAGWPKEEAFFTAIKGAPELYAELCVGTLQEHSSKLVLVVPYSQKLYDRIIELEPMPSDAAQKRLSQHSFLKPTTEEVLKYGY